MLAYQSDAESHGAVVALNSSVVGGDVSGMQLPIRPFPHQYFALSLLCMEQHLATPVLRSCSTLSNN